MRWPWTNPAAAPQASDAKLRGERTLREPKPSVAQIADLYALTQMPGYAVLLDVMEAACIQQETALINTPAEDEGAVLAAHKMTKARWEFFIWVQKFVSYHVAEALAPKHQPLDAATAEQETLLNPLR